MFCDEVPTLTLAVEYEAPGFAVLLFTVPRLSPINPPTLTALLPAVTVPVEKLPWTIPLFCPTNAPIFVAPANVDVTEADESPTLVIDEAALMTPNNPILLAVFDDIFKFDITLL